MEVTIKIDSDIKQFLAVIKAEAEKESGEKISDEEAIRRALAVCYAILQIG